MQTKDVLSEVQFQWEKSNPYTMRVGDACYAHDLTGEEQYLFDGFICFVEPGLLLWYWLDAVNESVDGISPVKARVWQWDFAKGGGFNPVESALLSVMLEAKALEIKEAYDAKTKKSS